MLLTYADLLARPAPKPDLRLAYGRDPLQFGELWLPPGGGPHPVVTMIHGGCWLADLPGLEMMDHLAGALCDEGLAVWNLEYRRMGHAGGGYPGTFTDAGAGLDHLRNLARAHRLDLSRVVSVGHSAGGHLAVWAAARSRLAAASPLQLGDPLPVRGAVSLAGIVDLFAYRASGIDACGGPSTIDALVGAAVRANADLYADTSPAAMLPLGIAQTVISGALDPIVPPWLGRGYVTAAIAAGDRVDSVEIAGAGHFEMIDPTSAAWPAVRDAVVRMTQ